MGGERYENITELAYAEERRLEEVFISLMFTETEEFWFGVSCAITNRNQPLMILLIGCERSTWKSAILTTSIPFWALRNHRLQKLGFPETIFQVIWMMARRMESRLQSSTCVVNLTFGWTINYVISLASRAWSLITFRLNCITGLPPHRFCCSGISTLCPRWQRTKGIEDVAQRPSPKSTLGPNDKTMAIASAVGQKSWMFILCSYGAWV